MSRTAPPPNGSVEDAPIIPEATANIFSRLTFDWITPLLSLGYARPLVTTDLYKLQDSRGASKISENILTSFEKRLAQANEYNERLSRGEISPGWRSLWWTLRGNRKERETEWREKHGKKKASLVFAMNDSIFWWFWSAGALKLLSDVSQVLSPLLVKVTPIRINDLVQALTSSGLIGDHPVCSTILSAP